MGIFSKIMGTHSERELKRVYPIVDKIEAIQWCKERFDLDTVICFGDGQNDIEMIRQADLGICMQNGHPDLKKVADLVIGDVNEDGIYQFLNESHRI